MEKNSPGFIDYFVVGEHFLRFIDSSWTGDKYGFPKQQPIGIIWIFYLLVHYHGHSFLLGKIKGKIVTYWNEQWQLFLWLWVLWTPFFLLFQKSYPHLYFTCNDPNFAYNCYQTGVLLKEKEYFNYLTKPSYYLIWSLLYRTHPASHF